MKSRTIAVVLLLAVVAGSAGAAEPPDLLHATPETMQWWQDARFGMFVCWGPVSLTGKEIGWSRGAPAWGRRPGVRGAKGPTPVDVYDNLYKQWKPDKFDARAWVQLAKQTGQKYMIFLVKHHDGFSLYDTKLTDFKSTGAESAWKVDVMKEIADACHEADLKLILYYSQPDWHHADYLTDNHDRYVAYLHGQIRELLTNYGRIDGLWFDNLRSVGPEAAKLWDAEKLFKMARSIQPHLIINNRCGLPGDFDTPEQRLGGFQLDRPWETCMTLGTQWSWKPDDKVKSLKQAVDTLVTCAVRNGNLALNTNPMPDGQIEPRQAARFREIGRWLGQYGQSIYGTRGGPFRSTAWGGTTHKDKTVYVHILKWPDGGVFLPDVEAKILTYRVLTGGKATIERTDGRLDISVAPQHRHELDTIVELTLDVPPGQLKPGRLRSGSIATDKKATASNVFQNAAEYRPAMALDDDPATRWGCDWGTHAAWLEVDLGKPLTFTRAQISEPYDRVRKFELQAKDGADWKTFYDGTTIGESLSVKFPAVTARHVRLNLLETTDGPSIWEFQLFK
ncbi:MAG: alpha-L-fucosidase [Candidatus Nealsonbacteria bacterium]|nr:alpha-L-fucosidase [Candidatus Nealsonbacteria bacterium]